MKHYLYGRVTARTGTGALAVAKKTSSALSLSFSFRLLFSFSGKQAPLARELASAGHTVRQCVPHSPTKNLPSAQYRLHKQSDTCRLNVGWCSVAMSLADEEEMRQKQKANNER